MDGQENDFEITQYASQERCLPGRERRTRKRRPRWTGKWVVARCHATPPMRTNEQLRFGRMPEVDVASAQCHKQDHSFFRNPREGCDTLANRSCPYSRIASPIRLAAVWWRGSSIPPHHLSVNAEAACEGAALETLSRRASIKTLWQRIRRHGDTMLVRASSARCRDRVTIRGRVYDAAGNFHVEGVRGFYQGLGLIGARGEALR